jgi:hypothetical protein
MFGKKNTFDDEKQNKFVTAISTMLETQMLLTDSSIESTSGCINRKAIGYIYGFIDCALRTIGQDMADAKVSVPIIFQVMRKLFPGYEEVYTTFLIDHVQDEVVLLGMMVGGQQYADFSKPGAKGAPMGLARFILEDEDEHG